jgi:hypothetical protein
MAPAEPRPSALIRTAPGEIPVTPHPPRTSARSSNGHGLRQVWCEQMIWYVIYEDRDGRIRFRAARSRDPPIPVACEPLEQSFDVNRVSGPDNTVVEHAGLDTHDDGGCLPGIRRIALLPICAAAVGSCSCTAVSGKRPRIAVGTHVTMCPPHRSRRAVFPHRAPTLGV